MSRVGEGGTMNHMNGMNEKTGAVSFCVLSSALFAFDMAGIVM